MPRKTVRLTMAQALVRYLCNQLTEIEGKRVPLFAGVFGIFGHGNVTCLSEALEQVQEQLPTWRGQNEQSMALAAIGFAKAKRRRQLMVAATSIGPGALNMVTAAGVAMANRLPVFSSGKAMRSSNQRIMRAALHGSGGLPAGAIASARGAPRCAGRRAGQSGCRL